MSKSIIFPGQGSQYLEMGKNLFENFSYIKDLYYEVDDALNFKLSDVILKNQDKNLLNFTQNTQPAIMITSYAIFKVLKIEKNLNIEDFKYCAGHSLGEYTALLVAESIDLTQTAKILFNRGKFMQSAVPLGQGSMIAVLNINCEEMENFLSKKKYSSVQISNDNCPGQVVLSGSLEDINLISIEIKAKLKKKYVTLPVSAPFHCGLMKDAEDQMNEFLKNINFRKPKIPIISNYSAEVQEDPKNIKDLLIKQICGRVRWRESINLMSSSGVKNILELGPGKTLTNMMKRFKNDIKTLNIENFEDIKSYD